MRNETLVKTFIAEGAVAAQTIIKHGSGDGGVDTATANTDNILGVSTILESAIGDRCDVIVQGIAEVIYGGAVAAGDLLTADASGFAITGTGRVIGQAMVAGVSGDIGSVLISTGSASAVA